MTFSKCLHTSKRIVMCSPLGAANYTSLLYGTVVSLKRMGNTATGIKASDVSRKVLGNTF